MLCWAASVVTSCFMLYKVALVFDCYFVVVSANFSSCQVVFVFSFSFDDVFFANFR